MEKKEPIVYINGEYLPRSKARIDPFDYGWRRGWVVYDATAAWKGYFFKLEQHIERLWRSLRMARIDMPLSREEAKQVFIETVKRNGLRDANVWMYVSYGVPTAGGYILPPAKPTVMSLAVPFLWLFGMEAQKVGIKAIISSIRSLPPQCVDPRLKHVNRMNMCLAEAEAKAANTDTPILLDMDGCVTENNVANVFVIKDGKIYTPSEGGVLSGVTRETFLEIARGAGIPASETGLRPYDLFNADEVFLSNSATGTVPIVEISGRRIGNGKPGAFTQKLHGLYWKMRERKEYGTPIYT